MKKQRWENCQVAPLISFVAMDTPAAHAASKLSTRSALTHSQFK
jgi:hypothetical protein